MKIRFLMAGERGIFERLKALADKAREETPFATKLLQQRVPDNDAFGSMKALENQSDELTFNLSEDIMDGAINPAVLRDLLHVTDQMDTVFDDYYFLAREVNRMANTGIELPMFDGMSKTFVEMVGVVDKELEMLGKLLEASSLDEVKSCRKEVEKLEEEGDDLKDRGFDDMYQNHGSFDYFSFQHYTAVLKKLDDIQDGVEDMSDLISAIANTLSR